MNRQSNIETTKEKSLYTRKSAAGKGDSPRNISRKFWENWDNIKGFKKSKYK